jgi:hypothetical protein
MGKVSTHVPGQACDSEHDVGIVAAPLYNQKKWQFAGMLTLSDIIHLIQFYYLKAETFETAAADVETFRIESLRGAHAYHCRGLAGLTCCRY